MQENVTFRASPIMLARIDGLAEALAKVAAAFGSNVRDLRPVSEAGTKNDLR